MTEQKKRAKTATTAHLAAPGSFPCQMRIWVYGSFVIPYPAYLPGHGSPAFYDSLHGNGSSYGWDEHVYYGSEEYCNFIGGAYSVNAPKGYYIPCYAQFTNFSDFAFEVDMKIIKGECGGIIFRADNIASKLYFFRVCQNGTYVLFRYVDNGDATDLIDHNNTAIKTGLDQVNQLAIVAKGTTIIFYINSQQIASVQDGSYANGKIALLADAAHAPTEVVFSNAAIWVL